ncbi:MAG TPA: hypothetical protein VGE72_13015 [Azospirillum sp.]
MLRHAVPIALSAAAFLLAAPPTAGAGSLACQTVNGQTTCLEGSGTLSCKTVNGQTTCTTSRDTATRPTLPKPPWPLVPEFDGSSQDVTVEQRDGKLHVRAGGVDMVID